MTEPETPNVVRVKVEPNTRLEQLLAMYDQLKPAADEAKKRLDACVDSIKSLAVAQAKEGDTRISVDAPHIGVALTLTWSAPWTFDSKKLKAKDPETWVRYAKQGGSWTLTRAKP